MHHKKYSNSAIIFINILIYLIFMVLNHSTCGEENGINSSFDAKNASTLELYRVRRSIRRGLNYYYQRGYDKNRLQFEKFNKFSVPRTKPFFQRVNEVYSFSLPRKFNFINSFEKFDDKNRKYGTKSRPRSGSRDPFSLINKPLLQTPSYLSRIRQKDSSLSNPLSRVQQNYRRQNNYYNQREQDGGDSSSYSSFSMSSSAALSPSNSGLIPESQNIVKNSTYDGIPGWIRVDYPGYATVPYTGFRCDLQPYYGYYADTNAGCQVYHVCQLDGRNYSFLCPNGTLYHQKLQTCDWYYHVDCPASPSFYYLNARIGVLPPQPATLNRFD